MKLTAALSFLLLSTSLAARPNIVFILADDLGYGDVEAFGGEHCNVDTPRIDALCAEGMKFTDAHVTNSVCIPSRISIMTGRYAMRFAPPEKGGPWGFLGLQFPPETTFTLADMFRRAGYVPGYVGKWHLGTRMATTDGEAQGPENTDFTKPLLAGPADFGFAHSFILPGSLDMFPYAFIENGMWEGPVTAQKGWSAFNRVGPAAEDFVDHEVLGRFAVEADEFIAGHAEQEKPFFLFVALTAPHTPTSPSLEFEGKSRIGVYGDFLMEVDEIVGRVADSLEKAGIADETLLMMSSDHGPGHYSGRKREATAFQIEEMIADGHKANGPFRGYKFSAFEGGLRVPFVARWPEVIPAGSTSDALIGLNDLFATWAEVAGAELEPDEAPDSISFANLLRDPAAEPARTTIAIQGTRGNVYRKGKWKLLLCPGSGSSGQFATPPESDEAWRAAVEKFGRKPKDHAELEQPPFLQLYDLETDPSESNNVAAENPDLVVEMIKELRAVLENGRTTSGEPQENGRRLEVFQPVPKFVWKK